MPKMKVRRYKDGWVAYIGKLKPGTPILVKQNGALRVGHVVRKRKGAL